MPYEIKHCHYNTPIDEGEYQLALFKVYRDGALAAVIRNPTSEAFVAVTQALHGKPVPTNHPSTVHHRVDCRIANEELRAEIQKYLPGRTFQYFADPTWTWTDNGTYEEMPWNAEIR